MLSQKASKKASLNRRMKARKLKKGTPRFEPIVPSIAEDSICRSIFIRSYSEPVDHKRSRTPRARRPLPSLDGTVAVFDVETVDHEIVYGVVEIYRRFGLTPSWNKLKPKERVVFYRDDLRDTDPDGYQQLLDIARELDVKLVSREWLFQNVIWPARRSGWVLAGHNVTYDLTRVSDYFEPATKTARLGTRFCNGFALFKSFQTQDGNPPPPFCRIKRDDRHHVRFEMKNAVVVDTEHASFAYTDRGGSLETACDAWGIPFGERPGAHSGEISFENVQGCLHDVRKTAELLWAINTEHKRYPHRPHLGHLPSGAALAKSDLDALGIRPRFELQPDFSKERCGQAAAAYFAGWVEATIGGPMPVVYLDFLSMFVSSHALLGLWKHYTATRLEVELVARAEIEALLDRVRTNPDLLFDPVTHKGLDFFALVDPNGATLPARVMLPTKQSTRREKLSYTQAQLCEAPQAGDSVISIGPVPSTTPLWYAGPDLAMAAMRGGSPRIIEAWRLRPEGGMLDSLTPLSFRGDDLIDPRTEDFFVRLIELRIRETEDDLDNKRRKTGYKVVALSGVYGAGAETNPIDIDPDDPAPKQRPVVVYSDKVFQTKVGRPERPGRFNFFPTSALITAEARLLLAMAKHEVERRGGSAAYCDTDSVAPVATEHGGFVPCDGGPYVMEEGQRAVRALSWSEVEEVRERFARLNPYNRVAIPGSILKIEDENYALGPDRKSDRSQRNQLYCYAVSEKLYALYTLDSAGDPVVRKYSSLVIGQLRSPVKVPHKGNSHAWIVDAWTREIRIALGKPVAPFAWESYPAMEQLTMSTWNVYKGYREHSRPGDFLIVGIISQDRADVIACPRRCCKNPRPSCMLFDDPAQWREQDWRCLSCGASWDFNTFPRLRTYGEIVDNTLRRVDRKRLNADGSEAAAVMHGATIARPVRVDSITRIGKELTADPTDTNEDYTAEMLSASDVLRYVDPQERFQPLRAAIRKAGIKAIARLCGVSRSQLQAIVNQNAAPNPTTLAKIEEALRVLGEM
jgi:transcriptional regulator with XRE-family HTH domain